MDEARYFKVVEEAARIRHENERFAEWAQGYGVIQHTDLTQVRIEQLRKHLEKEEVRGDGVDFLKLLQALDRVTSAGMWLVVHQTYAKNVYLDGRDLEGADFKAKPEGHTGGSLNMVPAYAGYLATNVLDGVTRGWLMGQGHCVAAVDSLNLLVENMTSAHAERYSLSDEGLTRYAQDFYSYRLRSDGSQDSPLGSHVNAHTAGGIAEGGYLGFAELQYVHMPLPGERLVVFLSDGAFEEQRGSDWAPRWWRAEDSGLVAPIMINNGRRIDQRTTMSQQGGVTWFVEHLRLNGFDPIVFDGRDPAAFVWAIIEVEQRLEKEAGRVKAGRSRYPVKLPYGIAVAPKGAGFPGEGTNLAHNLPLMENPKTHPGATRRFNEGAGKVWGPLDDLKVAISRFTQHDRSERPRERDNLISKRDVTLEESPSPQFRPVKPDSRASQENWTFSSPMAAIDSMFTAVVRANAHLRPRVGNPDEMRSNRLLETLEELKFRVTDPEQSLPEAIDGAVITALNEEAVAAAALANKGGINLIHTYEAFGPKMLGALRQEIIFSNHCREHGAPQRWLSVPLLLTSHTWENGKNEQSHQDPSLSESLLAEPFDVSRVLFPPDFNCAAAAMEAVYKTHGQIWSLVVPKRDSIPDLFTEEEAQRLVVDAALRLDWAGYKSEKPEVVLAAVGAYQLSSVLRASRRLAEREVPHSVVYLLEPGRFRVPRTTGEREMQVASHVVEKLFPDSVLPRLFVTHTRPEAILGLLGPLHTGRDTSALGYTNRGGTLNTEGMLFVNGVSWAHCVREVAGLLKLSEGDLLDLSEIDALRGKARPHEVLISEVFH
jgi:phosphoketolase